MRNNTLPNAYRFSAERLKPYWIKVWLGIRSTAAKLPDDSNGVSGNVGTRLNTDSRH